ncbi:SDR family oxidoreductase [Microcella flavibacter]|uniref:SDR family oxidoreductase n=1 Tax=Microcella flavibacter TaxID=1804990 RepID=UPI0014576C16|nr:SDR family oxidoreductase [Microcella flavibacter]
MTGPTTDPRTAHRSEGFPEQDQQQPGLTEEMDPRPDHGEESYRGAGRLVGRRALITGGDSGIGRAVAIAFAREGADVAIAYLPEEEDDAVATLDLVRAEGRAALALPGDLREEGRPTAIVERTIAEFGGLDLLVLNAAHQRARESIEELPMDGFDRVMRTNLYAVVESVKAAVPHLEAGASIIVTASIQGFDPKAALVDYAMTKAAQVAFVEAMASELGEKGIRVNAVAPGPIWTPLIPATGWPDKLPSFGQDTPLGRAGQPAEVAPAYVYLASDAASYVSGAVLPVTGGKAL